MWCSRKGISIHSFIVTVTGYCHFHATAAGYIPFATLVVTHIKRWHHVSETPAASILASVCLHPENTVSSLLRNFGMSLRNDTASLPTQA
jgi:hypothetical protein